MLQCVLFGCLCLCVVLLCYAHQAHYILDGAKRSFEPRREHCVFKACIIIVTYFVAFVAILAVISFIYGHCRLCTLSLSLSLSLSRSVALKSKETHQTTETFTFCGIFHFFFLFFLFLDAYIDVLSHLYLLIFITAPTNESRNRFSWVFNWTEQIKIVTTNTNPPPTTINIKVSSFGCHSQNKTK